MSRVVEMVLGGTEIRWHPTESQGCSVVRPQGDLVPATYREFTDGLIKFALTEPRALIVVIDDLGIASEPLLTAFSSAWMRVGEWPGVPILLVAHAEARRKWLRGSAVHWFVPIFADLPAALGQLGEPPRRWRTTLDLSQTADCGQRARAFVEDMCDRWEIPPPTRVDALLVVTELVENSFLHSRIEADIQLRLELRGHWLTVAVGDDDPHEAVLREPGVGGPRHYGLHIVARLARSWGCAPRWPKGKVVWAVLPVDPRENR